MTLVKAEMAMDFNVAAVAGGSGSGGGSSGGGASGGGSGGGNCGWWRQWQVVMAGSG